MSSFPAYHLDYTPPPTVQRMMQCDGKQRLICGPVGSGKTSGCIMEILRRCTQQSPSRVDGFRYSRWAVVRNTAPQLRDTTIKSFLDWIPDGVLGTWRATDKTFRLEFNDVRAEIMFRALDGPGDIRNLLSLELTGVYLNECREIHPDLIDPLIGRLGRYPKQGSTELPYWTGLIADTNPPNIESWWWAMMEDVDPFVSGFPPKKSGWDVFRQPSGRSPFAENLKYLPDDYYSTAGKSDDYILVYIDGEYGRTSDGFPVYDKSFVPDLHVSSDPLQVIRSESYPIVVGLDFGRTPAAVICQYDYRGRLLVHDEIVTTNMGIENFANNLLKPLLKTAPYRGMPVIVVCDPAGNQKSQVSEESPVDVLRRVGFARVRLAPSNNPERRQGALESLLLQQVDGKGQVLIDKKAKMLVNGLSFGYIYGKDRKGELRQTGARAQVVKNIYSHVCEALEYAAMDNRLEGGVGLRPKRTYKIAPPQGYRWFV